MSVKSSWGERLEFAKYVVGVVVFLPLVPFMWANVQGIVWAMQAGRLGRALRKFPTYGLYVSRDMPEEIVLVEYNAKGSLVFANTNLLVPLERFDALVTPQSRSRA